MKTKIKLLCPAAVWQPKRGARPGNRNAWKTGYHSARMRNLRSRIHAFKAYARDAMRRADRLVEERMEALERRALMSSPTPRCHGPRMRATQMGSARSEGFARGDAEFAEDFARPRSPRLRVIPLLRAKQDVTWVARTPAGHDTFIVI